MQTVRTTVAASAVATATVAARKCAALMAGKTVAGTAAVTAKATGSAKTSATTSATAIETTTTLVDVIAAPAWSPVSVARMGHAPSPTGRCYLTRWGTQLPGPLPRLPPACAALAPLARAASPRPMLPGVVVAQEHLRLPGPPLAHKRGHVPAARVPTSPARRPRRSRMSRGIALPLGAARSPSPRASPCAGRPSATSSRTSHPRHSPRLQPKMHTMSTTLPHSHSPAQSMVTGRATATRPSLGKNHRGGIQGRVHPLVLHRCCGEDQHSKQAPHLPGRLYCRGALQ